jgi:hypothetical protein
MALPSLSLTPNIGLKKAIQAFREQRPELERIRLQQSDLELAVTMMEQDLASLRTQPSVISGRRRCNVRAGMACHWHDRCRIDRNLRDEEQVLRHSARATSRQCLGSRPQCVFAIGNGGDARDMVRVSGDRVCLVELMDPRLCLTSTAWLTSAAANCKAASLSLHWHGSSYSLLRPGGSEGRIAEDLHRPPAVQRLAII